MGSAREELKRLIIDKALRHGDFTLTSGAKSTYYIDGKQVTLDPEGAHLVGEVLFDLIKDLEVDAIGGLTLGADPVATAVAVISHERGKPIPAFIVRKGAKAHGIMKRIEGPIKPDSKVVIVEDVVTKGGSALKAAKAAEEEGHTVVKVICLVDRLQGGREALESAGYDFEPVFEVTELGVKP
ncbi:MAG: orotate phosphoribosyltransferase [Actinobacteria bacterium]|nr:orotate phosphoribosyltransferase [Actinomycetota bacterium]